MHAHLSGTAGSFALPEGIAVLGRGKDCQIRINDPRLSRHHARFIFDGSHLAVEDVGSTNGILVNTERVEQRMGLKQGDAVVCGPCLFTVQMLAEPLPPQPQQAIAHELLPGSEESSDPDTEDMRPIQESGLTSNVPRQLDSKIQAALGGTPATTDRNLIPDEFPPPETSALAAHPPTPVPPGLADQTPTVPGKPSVTKGRPSDLLLSDRRMTGTARQTRLLPIPKLWQRAGAGLLDGAQTLLLIMIVALPPLVLGLCMALHQAGAVIDGDQPRFITHAPQSASLVELLGLVWTCGVGRSCLLIRDLFLMDDRGPFMIFFAGATASLLAATVVALVTLVAATVLRGAPMWHRRFGLEIVEDGTGYFLTWPRALARWGSFVILGPLSPIGLFLRRGLHDVLCRCLLVARKR